ncbi:MAG: hypothetical protein A2901_04430 [Elusimicrobia bacterium RIFCSPLOWO2_01_FULL_54_10]|nr:MAG: hypothetical protein A2901_04430 [Elusimicrobia bacterium RIFCSPLOWO2_01_FULL_54_10]
MQDPFKPNSKIYKILVADDNQSDAEILSQLLRDNGYECILAHNGIDALESGIRHFPDLILLDVDMPGENGYEVARQLKAHKSTRMVPIIMLTALSELGAKLEGLEAGVDDFITKPYRQVELLTRIRSLLRVKSLNDQLDDVENIVFTLARIIEAKDSYTLGHADRVSRYSVLLGKLLKRSEAELEILDKGGVLHDIGKMAIPDSILLKPGSLTREEFDIMKTHPVTGCSICERLRSAQDALPLIRHHHEKLDGSGYPDGLKRDEIPVLVRIVTISDIYDALTTRRSYKDAWTLDKTFSVMYEEVKRGWWDGDILRTWEKFVRSEDFNTMVTRKIHVKTASGH